MSSPLTFKPALSVALLTLALSLLPKAAADPDATRTCADSLGQPWNSSEHRLSAELQVLSWNIQKASKLNWNRDLYSFGSDVQLLFLQEAPLQAELATAIPAPLHEVFAAGYSTDDLDTGVMTLSNGTPSLHCALTAREPWLRTPKATGITEFPIQDRQQRLLAINIHAVNFTVGLAGFEQQIYALGDILTRHRGPVIIAGDLNTWSGARQAVVTDFMQRHELSPVTFEPDHRTTVFGLALDHIYTRGIEVASAHAVPVSSSDHNPLLVTLEIL